MKTWIRGALLVSVLALPLAGCFTTTINHGHVIRPERVRDIQVGSSREQVELLLGSPSTSSRLDGEAYYYISQVKETTAFLMPETVEQRVVAIYFDEEGFVRDTAYYSLEDGKVVDILSRKTRTGGADYGFLSQILRGAQNPSLNL
ncbi:outer membrane protein assembly factor BamE [Stappia sp. WLB 29]|jgi:outer membrane protein assembly factor BamE (lipoprotein component of BamABCDE complex)|uniref:outer membrane protein assembly factor BamE n=1 Tax=Stappia sp. WLB 29 TaxID=2925220 RepID=UPI0020BE1FE1|nr:outer membrane protein assembly factor BamE [Stappia sp. WLB 29]